MWEITSNNQSGEEIFAAGMGLIKCCLMCGQRVLLFQIGRRCVDKATCVLPKQDMYYVCWDKLSCA